MIKFLFALFILFKLTGTSWQTSNVFRFEPIVLIEEPPIGTLVLDLANKLDIKDLATSDYKFRFYSPQSITSHYFLIDQLTGHVKTQRTLDREFLCETKVCGPCTSTSNCSLPIEIVATQTQNQKSSFNKHQMTIQKFVSFDVIIEDKNEFAPKFPKEIIYLNISEGAPANFSIPIEPAMDRDSKQTQIKYTLEPVLDNEIDKSNYQLELEKLNSKIRLLIDQSSNSQSQLNLILLEPFDYEQQKEVRFKILASDDGPGQKVLTGSCLVVLNIIDMNDNLPIFDNNQYEYRLDEDKALAGTRLIRVHATDKDDGLNAQVKYSLVDQNDLFQIDSQTGWISVSPIANLDYEQMSTHRLIVKAQDSGLANSMPVFTNCIIYLNDVNDNPPRINISLPSSIDDFNTNLTINSQNQIELSEWTMPNTFIAQVLVTDLDSGLNGKVKLELHEFKQKSNLDYDLDEESEWIESNDFSLIHLFNNIYSLMLKQALDREMYDKYLINITATDYGQPVALKTSLKLNIKILDENDNKPVFIILPNISKIDKKSNKLVEYEFNITEVVFSEEEWLNLGKVKAVDYDTGKNALITYELEPVDKLFRIDSKTGLIQAQIQALDREKQDSYEFTLIAKDSLNKESVKLRINLLDANDNEPRFEKSVYRFQIYENYFNPDRVYARLGAFDLDKENTSFSTIRFGLLDQNDYFRINSLTGELFQTKEFDFERMDYLELRAIVYDNFNKTPSLNSTCLIQFEIIDLNDNPPVLDSPNDSDMPLVYSLDSLLNDSLRTQIDFDSNRLLTKILKLNASDLDSGLNSKLIYSIERQVKLKQEKHLDIENEQDELLELFSLDPRSGVLSAKIEFNKKFNSKPKRNALESRLIGSYRLNTSVHKYPSNFFADYEYDTKIPGLYGLIVNISDLAESSPLSIRVYVFLALTGSSNLSLNPQIKLLKSILNETRPNFLDYDYEYENKEEIDFKFNRVLSQFQKSTTIKLAKKKPTSNSQTIQKLKPTYLEHLLSSYFNIKNSQSYSYLILFFGSVCVLLIILILSLCLFSIYYKRIKQKRNLNNSAKKHLCEIYTDSLDSSSKKNTLITTTVGSSKSSTSSSASPSSMTSTELLNTHSSIRNSTDDDEDDSGGFRSSRQNKKDFIREEERAVLIVNTSSSSSNNNLGSVSSSSTNTSKTNPLLVLVTSSSSSTSPNDKKLIVASSESVSTTKSSFKTFKTDLEHPKHTILLTNEYSNSYRTLPINNHKNLDQTNKGVNMPVNELFKRYELKRQATNGLVVSSSGSLSSLNSVTKKINRKNSSPKIVQRSFNLNPSMTQTSQIPDYFFKDEREQKLFKNKPSLNLKQVVVDSTNVPSLNAT